MSKIEQPKLNQVLDLLKATQKVMVELEDGNIVIATAIELVNLYPHIQHVPVYSMSFKDNNIYIVLGADCV